MARMTFDTQKIEERWQALSQRVTHLADRGLDEARSTIESVGSAAEAQIVTAAELVAQTTRAAKAALDGPIAREWNSLVISAVEAARRSAKRWLAVATEAIASTRRLAADVLDRGGSPSA